MSPEKEREFILNLVASDSGFPDDSDINWEKTVEFEICRVLQSIHLETKLQEWVYANTRKASTTEIQAKLVEMQDLAVLLSKQPRYIPLSGNLEAKLGDAIARGSDFLLLEAKGLLNMDAWGREAMPSNKKTGCESFGVHGGKDRFMLGMSMDDSLKCLGRSCHFIAGRGKGEIRLASYWEFIIEYELKYSIALDDVTTVGLARDDFEVYIVNLLALATEQAEAGSGAASGITPKAEQAVDKILISHLEEGVTGFQVSLPVLRAALKDAPRKNPTSRLRTKLTGPKV